MKEPIKHSDRLGRDITIDCIVAYSSGNMLEIGKVTKLNPKMVKVIPIGPRGWRDSETNKYPSEMVVLEGADVTMYLLKANLSK